MPQLKRTESLIVELSENQLPTPNLNTHLNMSMLLAYLSSSSPPLASTDDFITSASTWVSLPPPPHVLPKLPNCAHQYSSSLGPSPHKLYRRIYPHSLPKPNLYRRALITSAKRAALPASACACTGSWNIPNFFSVKITKSFNNQAFWI